MAQRPPEKDRPYWETLRLEDMSMEQFESLCDGCARCCVHKLEDVDTAEIVFTDVACRLLDSESARCTDYANRTARVEGCVAMSPTSLEPLAFLPDSCAYRRINEGRGLADWHPLVAGNTDAIVQAGISMRGQTLSETFIHVDDIAFRRRDDIAWTPPERRV